MHPDEQKLKEMLAQECAKSSGSIGGAYALQQACRTPLRERVESVAYRADQEARKAGRAKELAMLLDENPKIARILDLMEEFR